MSFINYAADAAETVTRDWVAFFKGFNANMAIVDEFSLRGFGSSIEGDKGVPKGEGVYSWFKAFDAVSSKMFDLSAEKK